MSIGNLDVSVVLDKELDNVDVSVEAGGSQRRRVRLGGRVDVSAFANQVLDDLEVTGRARTPQRRRAFDVLALEVHQTCLLDACRAVLH